MVTVVLKRINKADTQKVGISHFPKVKDCSWFLIIGNPTKNDVVAMKRVNFNRYTSKSLTIVLPDDFLKEKLELYLMSDSYIGMDQYYQIDLIQINGKI